MLFLLLLRLRLFILITLFLILIGSVNAARLGVSPGSIELDFDKGERVCRDFRIYSDFSGILEIRDLWNLNESRIIADFKNEGREFGIKVEYPFTLDLNENEEKIKVCFSGENEGEYYGLLLFAVKERKVGVGVWMDIKIGDLIRGENQGFEFRYKELENENSGKVTNGTNIVGIMMLESSFLLILAVFLLFFIAKMRKRDEEI